MSATVTAVEVDRQLLEDVYLECAAMVDAFEDLVGTCPTDFTERASHQLETLLAVLVGADARAQEAWWERTKSHARVTLLGQEGDAS